MVICTVCGRDITNSNIAYTKQFGTLCSKHMHQLYKYGYFLDKNPRTQQDPNDYRIEGDYAIINLYNQKSIKVGEFIIDLEDLERVIQKKWRISFDNHIVTGNCTPNNPSTQLSYIVLNIPVTKGLVIDHIDCNPFNNRKNNLRVCLQSQNCINRSFCSRNKYNGIIGCSWSKDHQAYAPEIRANNQRVHLSYYDTFEEGVFARLIAEERLFKEYQNLQQKQLKLECTKNLSKEQKQYIGNKVHKKLDEKAIDNHLVHIVYRMP